MTTPLTGAGAVLALIRSGQATTRKDLIDALGWSRMTLARRLDELLEAGLVVGADAAAGGLGRPPQEFRLAKDSGLILAIDVGSSQTRVGLTDLASNVLMEADAEIGLHSGPGEVLDWAVQVFDFLLAKVGRARSDVRAVGIGVPGAVDPDTGRMGTLRPDPRWDGFDPQQFLRGAAFDAVVAVDRDVNMLALGEARLCWPNCENLIVVKVGMDVGVAFVLSGHVYGGSRGGAGRLRAPMVSRDEPWRDLTTVASGAVIRSQLAGAGIQANTTAEIVASAKAGDPLVTRLLDEVGEDLGAALGGIVGTLNPDAVIVGGSLAAAGDRFIGAVRTGVISHVLPFTRRGLIIERARLGDLGGVRGASLASQDALFDIERINGLLRAQEGA